MIKRSAAKGFTLAEIAVVLVIIGLLLGGLFVPLTAQIDSRNVNDTQKTMSDIRDALLGFASANGRLPCPASATSNGVESPTSGTGLCTNANDGFVPAVTLGVGPSNSSGYVIDAWGNPIHYAVTTSNSNAFTVPYVASPAAGIKGIGMSALAPDIQVCADAACATPLTNATPGAVALIFSTGKEGITAGRAADENENLDGDTRFVSHEQNTASGSEFDDIVIWISPGTLYNRMITAGQLP